MHVRIAAVVITLVMIFAMLSACSGEQTPTDAQIIDAVKYGADALRALYGCEIPTVGETATVGDASRRAVDTTWKSGADALVEYVENAFTTEYFATDSARTRMFDNGPYFEDENGVLWIKVDENGVSAPIEVVPDFDFAGFKVVASEPGYAQATVASKDSLIQRTFTVKSRTDIGTPTRFVITSYYDVESPAA